MNQQATEMQKKKLTDEQLLKMEAAVIRLSKVTHNAQAITLAHNLKMSRELEEKRKWIVLFYAQCFQLLSFMNMGRDSSMTFNDFVKELETVQPREMVATVPNDKR